MLAQGCPLLKGCHPLLVLKGKPRPHFPTLKASRLPPAGARNLLAQGCPLLKGCHPLLVLKGKPRP
ncbi:hypothetical protein, partial [Streptomyces acidiscabies]|uniref:hypothetical protein n=1 Tax=Streptomyces acidiscabies TaxID=42234 RepID=UPI001C4B94AC